MFVHLGLICLIGLLAGVAWGRFGRNYRRRIRQLKDDYNIVVAKQSQSESVLDAMREVVLVLDRQGGILQANRMARQLFPFETPSGATLSDQELISIAQMAWGVQWQRQMELALARLPNPTHFPPLEIAYNGGSQMVLAAELVDLGEDRALFLGRDISLSVEQKREKEALFANLMHDLKTPLTSLIGYSNTIETMGDDPEVRQHAAGAIGRSAKRVNRLLDALLALHSAGGDVDDPCCVLDEVVNLMVDGVCDPADEAGIALHVQLCAEESVRVAMPRDACERVLTNVVENAIAYSPQGREVQLLCVLEPEWVVLRVLDEGCGVSQEKIVHLTERFYRVDRARGSHEGHGLGLAIVDELLQKFGGSMTITNRLPVGLQVELRLPRAELLSSSHDLPDNRVKSAHVQ